MKRIKKISKNRHSRKIKLILLSSIIFLCLSFLLVYNVLFLSNKVNASSRVNSLKNYDGFGNGYKTAGWLNVSGTNIDYPIIYSMDSSLDYPVESEKYGWITNDQKNSKDMLFINGHNIFNLSSNPIRESNNFKRFEELMNYVYYDFAKEHQYFQYTRNGKDEIYKIFGIFFIKAIDINYFYNDGDIYDNLKEEYIEYALQNSFYNYDIDVSTNDQIVSLVTCTRFTDLQNGTDFVVAGRLLRDGEKMDDYKIVSNSDVYNKIKKIMKGVDNNE